MSFVEPSADDHITWIALLGLMATRGPTGLSLLQLKRYAKGQIKQMNKIYIIGKIYNAHM
jgi:hypothetical protein